MNGDTAPFLPYALVGIGFWVAVAVGLVLLRVAQIEVTRWWQRRHRCPVVDLTVVRRERRAS